MGSAASYTPANGVRVTNCEELLERFNAAGVDFLHNVITVDKSWMLHYDLEMKYQTPQWKTMKTVHSTGKVTMIIFLTTKDSFTSVEYLHKPPSLLYGTSKSAKQCSHIFEKKYIQQRKLKTLHCIVITYVRMLLRSFAIFWRKKINIVPFPLYSPDLASCDFCLFPEVKKDLKGIKFETDADMVKAVEERCKELSKDGVDFAFKKWVKRWRQCIESLGG